MKIFILLFLIVSSQQAYANYEKAYEEASNSPRYIPLSSCYKYHYATGNAQESVKANILLELDIKRYLSNRGYSSSDIEVAVFANDIYIKTQIEEVVMAMGFESALANRRLANFKRFCAGGR